MKRINRIPITDLKAGMSVNKFDKPADHYPYYNAVLPDDIVDNTLVSLIDLDIQYAYINEDDSTYLLKPKPYETKSILSSNQDDSIYISLLTQLGEMHLSGAIGQAINDKSDYDYIIASLSSIIRREEILMYITSIRSYDENTFTHSIRVAIYSALLSTKLNLSESESSKLIIGALLHDIGKIYIPHAILNKPDKLDIHEFFMMQDHPVQSYNILKRDSIFDYETLLAVKHHHERSDGSGYPSALLETSIPLLAKLLAIADVYDAITSRRVYSNGMRIYDAISFIKSKSDKFFNKLLIDFFIQSLGIYIKGTLLLLDTGEVAVIFTENENTTFPPKVLIITNENRKPLKKPIIFDLNKKDKYSMFIKSIKEILDFSQLDDDLKELATL